MSSRFWCFGNVFQADSLTDDGFSFLKGMVQANDVTAAIQGCVLLKLAVCVLSADQKWKPCSPSFTMKKPPVFEPLSEKKAKL